MWIIIKRKSDIEDRKEPLCVKVFPDEVGTKVNEIIQSMQEHTLFAVTDKYYINTDDILSVQVYDESEYIEEAPVNVKPPKRRLNEG